MGCRVEHGLGRSGGREGRTMWIVDAHGYGKRFIVRAEKF